MMMMSPPPPKIPHKSPEHHQPEPQQQQQHFPFSETWEPRIADQIRLGVEALSSLDEAKSSNGGPRRPFMVALVGMPGSGKSTSSAMLAGALERRGISSTIVSHDGYHYPIAELKKMPDAKDLIYRRGAPETFDPEALIADLRRIRDGREDVVSMPGFDHARGDPEPGAHLFDRRRHQVVIGEGLYLMHDDDGWRDVQKSFDLSIYIDSDVEICVDRVRRRNACIPGYTPEQLAIRVEEVDRVNAETVARSKANADVVVSSTSIQPKVSMPRTMSSNIDLVKLSMQRAVCA